VAVGKPEQYDRVNRWGEWTPFTPTWSSVSNPQPSIGNGTVKGRCRRDGSLGFVRYHIKVGTTTTFGTNEWRLSLPTDWWSSPSDGEADWYQTCTGLCVPNGSSPFDLVCWVEAGAQEVRVIYPSYGTTPSAAVASASPTTWTASVINFVAIGPLVVELEAPTYS